MIKVYVHNTEARTKGTWFTSRGGLCSHHIQNNKEFIALQAGQTDSKFIATLSNHIDKLLDVAEAAMAIEEIKNHIRDDIENAIELGRRLSKMSEALEALEHS